MVGEREVSPIFPPSRTLCPASPSLQWVPWASVPHLLGLRSAPQTLGTMLRYDCHNPLSASFGCPSCADTLV